MQLGLLLVRLEQLFAVARLRTSPEALDCSLSRTKRHAGCRHIEQPGRPRTCGTCEYDGTTLAGAWPAFGPTTPNFRLVRAWKARIVIFRTKAGLRGVQRTCPHMQATMMNAELTANDTMVRCHLHVFTFKLSDGKGVNCPGFKIKVYEIKEENGSLYGRLAN
jgi:nitrite reductase/ring-hydroxylating ferredoxin subunit